MQRDQLLLAEMIAAAERAHQLTDGITLAELRACRSAGGFDALFQPVEDRLLGVNR